MLQTSSQSPKRVHVPRARRRRILSQIDSFFVAYQERSGILMQLGAEVELEGKITRGLLEAVLTQLVNRWPQLGQTLRRRFLGISWGGEVRTGDMLHTADQPDAVVQWRNRPINPFIEPPFQLLWIPGEGRNLVAFRAHHAVMDGQAFFYVCTKALHFLARLSAGEEPTFPGKIPGLTLKHLIKPLKIIRRGKLKSMWRYVRWMSTEAVANRSARIALQACEPGDIAICERRLDKDHIKELNEYAAAHQLTPFWLCAAAWIRAINQWNKEQADTGNSLISLEVPVSLRGKHSMDECIGNFISPLILFGDAAQPTVHLAGLLKQQFLKGVKDRSYLGMPVFTSPGKYLPWPLFRRVAVTTAASGFATSHFTWLEQKDSLISDIYKFSNGTLQMVDQCIYTPVCLHMGAALFVLAMPEHIQLFITHRLNALPTNAANNLADLLLKNAFGDQGALLKNAKRAPWTPAKLFIK
jgi:hypothetical protein